MKTKLLKKIRKRFKYKFLSKNKLEILDLKDKSYHVDYPDGYNSSFFIYELFGLVKDIDRKIELSERRNKSIYYRKLKDY